MAWYTAFLWTLCISCLWMLWHPNQSRTVFLLVSLALQPGFGQFSKFSRHKTWTASWRNNLWEHRQNAARPTHCCARLTQWIQPSGTCIAKHLSELGPFFVNSMQALHVPPTHFWWDRGQCLSTMCNQVFCQKQCKFYMHPTNERSINSLSEKAFWMAGCPGRKGVFVTNITQIFHKAVYVYSWHCDETTVCLQLMS